MEKISISHLHHHLRHPHIVFYCEITPQNIHHRDVFGAELMNLSILYCHWIFFIGQILVKLNCQRLKYLRRIQDKFSQYRHVKTGLICDSSGGNPNLYATSTTLDRISNGPMYLGVSLPFLPNLITAFI